MLYFISRQATPEGYERGESSRFLTHLAVAEHVSAATQIACEAHGIRPAPGLVPLRGMPCHEAMAQGQWLASG